MKVGQIVKTSTNETGQIHAIDGDRALVNTGSKVTESYWFYLEELVEIK